MTPNFRLAARLAFFGAVACTFVACSTLQEPVRRTSAQTAAEAAIHEQSQQVGEIASKDGVTTQSVPSGFTSHFATWLQNNGYGADNFGNIACYGGRTGASDNPVNQPVIFIHGNSDKALGTIVGQT